jgi:hypothetical protein
MKTLMAMIGLVAAVYALNSCARKATVPVSAPGASYPSSPYSTWTTAQLQQRRNDLYYMLPQRPAPGAPLPQQDEIRAIEVELNRRFRAGDKTAELKPAWPQGSPPQR